MTNAPLKQRLAAILCADAAGYSRLMSLKETFTEMAREQATDREEWSDLDSLASDGLDKLEW